MSPRKCTLQICLSTLLTVILSVMNMNVTPVQAAQGGYTNYVPGLYGIFGVAVAPAPGYYMLNDVYYYTASGSNTRVVQGTQVHGDIDLKVGAYILTGLWVTDNELFGGRY